MNALATALAVRGPFDEVVEQARLVAGLGYESIWVPEIAGRDALVTCAALAAQVPGTPLATGIVPLPTRSPVLLGMGAAALAEITGGRFTLGVGVGHVETLGPWFGRDAIDLVGVRAHLEVLRSLLHEGAVQRRAGGGLPELSMTLRGVHPPAPPPVLLAALGAPDGATGRGSGRRGRPQLDHSRTHRADGTVGPGRRRGRRARPRGGSGGLLPARLRG